MGEESVRKLGYTVMEEIEAAIDPDTAVEDGLVVLRISWPLAWLR